jgi:hypothetical protein
MNEKPTTVQGWLRWAEKAGHPWASAALGELERQRECPPTRPCVSLEYAILMGFEWCDSFEGTAFWKNIYDSLEDVEWHPIPAREMTPEQRDAAEKAELMLAFSRGEKIERKQRHRPDGWITVSRTAWDWGDWEYRIAPPKPLPRIALTEEIRAALDAAGIEYEEEPIP